MNNVGGEGGIRTLGTLRFTAFRERPVQPLLHLSNRRYYSKLKKTPLGSLF